MTDQPEAIRAALDPDTRDRLLDLAGGDAEFVDELIDTYLEDAPDQLVAMETAASAGALDDLVRPAHTLKSSSANMGATALADLCRSLEADARAGSVDDPVERVEAIATALDAAMDALTALRSSGG